MPETIESIDRTILDLVQTEIPFIERPFSLLAERAGIPETEFLERLSRLKEQNIIRQIGGIFDSSALGYQGVLLAFSVSPERLDQAAEIVSAHPGVSHNYSRDHEIYNLWLTLTVPPESDLQQHAASLARLAQVEHYLFLPALRVFKIGVFFQMNDEHQSSVSFSPSLPSSTFYKPETREDLAAIQSLQEDLPIEERPFRKLAALFELAESDLLNRAKIFLKHHILRRYAAILRHREAGYACNIMTVWSTEECNIPKAAKIISEIQAVSHCYQRPTAPDWPWPLFAMIHGRSMAEVLETVDEIRSKTGIETYSLLQTIHEYKKSRVKYFNDDVERWEKEFVRVLQ